MIQYKREIKYDKTTHDYYVIDFDVEEYLNKLGEEGWILKHYNKEEVLLKRHYDRKRYEESAYGYKYEFIFYREINF